MICPKCGNEFEGTTCPKCNSPAILVNASDYERRRREWEEREKQKNSEEQKKQKNRDDVRRVAKKIADTDYSQLVSSNAGRAAGFASRNRRILAMAGAVIAAAIVIIVLINAVTASGKNIFYVSDGSSIYKGMDKNNIICSTDDVIFNYDRSCAYTYNIVGDIDRQAITGTMVSSNGRYYAAVMYTENNGGNNESAAVDGNDDAGYIGESNSTAVNGNAISTGTYTLICWKKNGGYVSVKSSTDKKTIAMVTDDGMLVYTDTHYLNEGAVGAEILGCYYIDEQKNLTLSSDMDEYAVAAGNVIWTDSDGTLYRTKYKDSTAVRIARNVKKIYTRQKTYMYANVNGMIQTESAFVYVTQDGEYIYLDLSDKKNPDGIYLFTSASQTDSLVYIAKSGCAYTAGGGRLSRITGITDETVSGQPDDNIRKTETVSELASSSVYYSSDADCLYYVNKSDELVLIKNAGKAADISVSGVTVTSGITKSGIQYTAYGNDGFWYISQSSLCYCDGSSKQIKLKDGVKQGAVIYCMEYKNRIYCLHDGTLSRISTGGNVQMETGGIADIWTGRIRTR